MSAQASLHEQAGSVLFGSIASQDRHEVVVAAFEVEKELPDFLLRQALRRGHAVQQGEPVLELHLAAELRRQLGHLQKRSGATERNRGQKSGSEAIKGIE